MPHNRFKIFTNLKRVYWGPLFLVFLFFVSPLPRDAVAAASLVFSEIAWMGTAVSATDEWLELFNSSGQIVDLTGWKIISTDEKINISLAGQIVAGGYFLLERTDDTSAPGVAADQIYTGALNNTGNFYLRLYDDQTNLIDEIIVQDSWPAGDNTQKFTMERTSSLAWQSSAATGGTPRTANSSPINSPTPNPTPSPSTTAPLPAPTASFPAASPNNSAYQYSNEIFITEFLPAPTGGQNEWVELYNQGTSPVNLSGWQFIDSAANKRQLPENSVLASEEFLVVTITGSFLNNDGDTLSLLWPDGQVLHAVSFDSAPIGQSCARQSSGRWFWTNTPTPGEENKITSPITAKKESVSAAPSTLSEVATPLTTTPSPSLPPSSPTADPAQISSLPLLATTGNITSTFHRLTWLLVILLFVSFAVALSLIYFRRKTSGPRIDQE